ncbi:hypothetical protein AURDEDRAFT_124234 [Auricularia subglabra TFB-10046 SS5]|nr:hypothetical protein AURDEDRAFT_124234 [Auricularia subglabra TFB-10046 SS5]
MKLFRFYEEKLVSPVPDPSASTDATPVRRETRVSKALAAIRMPFWLILILTTLHATHAVMVYFYARTISHPLPRGVINHTHLGLMFFTAFTYIVGFAAGYLDAVIVFTALVTLFGVEWPRSKPAWVLRWVVCGGIGLAITVVFGMAGLIFAKVASGPAFRHACDGDWVSVLLEGHEFEHPKEPNRATFTLSATNEPLFTFTNQDPERWSFNLLSLDAARPAVLPALRNITFDDSRWAVSGLCYDANTTVPCMAGRYDPVAYLSFDVATNGTRARSRSVYREWSLDDIPSLILRREDGTRVLQTSPPNPGNCRQLKVCVAHQAGAARADVFPADVLVAVGWILDAVGEWARQCTTPENSQFAA